MIYGIRKPAVGYFAGWVLAHARARSQRIYWLRRQRFCDHLTAYRGFFANGSLERVVNLYKSLQPGNGSSGEPGGIPIQSFWRKMKVSFAVRSQ